MKKLLIKSSIALSFVMLLSGCQNGESTQAEQTQTTETTEASQASDDNELIPLIECKGGQMQY